MSRINDASGLASGLPLFSKSSSNLSERKRVAHSRRALFSLGFSSKKTPPICPLASRATQKPSMLRPIRNAGIVPLTTEGSRGRNCVVIVAWFSRGNTLEHSHSRFIGGSGIIGFDRRCILEMRNGTSSRHVAFLAYHNDAQPNFRNALLRPKPSIRARPGSG